MRLLTINLLAATALILSAAQAGAYQVWLTPSGTVGPVVLSDTVTVDVHFDTQGQSNITILGIAIQYDTTALTYLPNSSVAAGGPGTAAAAGTYILYTPAAGSTASTILYPAIPSPSTISYNPPRNPATGILVTGWVEPNFKATSATTADTILTTIVFHALGTHTSQISLAVGPAGTILQLGDGSRPTVATNNPLTVLVVPEPTTAMLIGLGLLGLGVAGRRSKA